jgi:hypothetical protein
VSRFQMALICLAAATLMSAVLMSVAYLKVRQAEIGYQICLDAQRPNDLLSFEACMVPVREKLK